MNARKYYNTDETKNNSNLNVVNFCETPNGKAGKCVLINHCPDLFNAFLNNKKDSNATEQIRQFHCGFESMLFPKVCCPIEIIRSIEETHFSKSGLKCGLHTPNGPSDPWLALLEYEIRKYHKILSDM